MYSPSHNGMEIDQTDPIWITPLVESPNHFLGLIVLLKWSLKVAVLQNGNAFIRTSMALRPFPGKLFGHFSKLILGHVVGFSKSQGGPFHHSELSDISWRLTPLVQRSAGFCWVGTYCHCAGSVASWISPIRLATKARKFRPCPRIHHSTSLLSEKNITVSIDNARMAIIRCVRRNPNTAPSVQALRHSWVLTVRLLSSKQIGNHSAVCRQIFVFTKQIHDCSICFQGGIHKRDYTLFLNFLCFT